MIPTFFQPPAFPSLQKNKRRENTVFFANTVSPLSFTKKRKRKKLLDSRSWFSGTAVETFPPLQGTYIGFYVMEFCLPSRACLHYTTLPRNCQTQARKKKKKTFFCDFFSLIVNFFDTISVRLLFFRDIRLIPHPRFCLLPRFYLLLRVFRENAAPRRPRRRDYRREA